MHPSLSSDHCRRATAVAPAAQPLPWLPLAYLAVSLLLGSGAMHFAGPPLCERARQQAATHVLLVAKPAIPPQVRVAAVPLRANRAGA